MKSSHEHTRLRIRLMICPSSSAHARIVQQSKEVPFTLRTAIPRIFTGQGWVGLHCWYIGEVSTAKYQCHSVLSFPANHKNVAFGGQKWKLVNISKTKHGVALILCCTNFTCVPTVQPYPSLAHKNSGYRRTWCKRYLFALLHDDGEGLS